MAARVAVTTSGAGAAPVLSTRGLEKSFGSLVVAREISVAVPPGVRYALIGPNGAGKTTLVNLVTGMLRPDAGRIFLGEDDITSLPPSERVKRGLVRTFQINTLFPHLTALEAVTLAVCERRGHASTWWRGLPAYRDAVDEAYGILASLALGADCYQLTRALGYGQQRLLEIALALAPGCRGARARRSSPPSPPCRTTSPCSSSSTTWTWSFASPVASS